METSTSSSQSPQENWASKTIVDFLKETKPALRNTFDAAALVLHFTMKRLGFRCLGCGDENDESAQSQALPSGWNRSSDSYSFRYRHPRSSMTFLVKAITLGEKLLIHGLALEDNKTQSFEINIKEFVNSDSLQNYDGVYKDSERLISLFRINILDHLLPPEKEGYQPTYIATSPSTEHHRQPQHRDDDQDYDPLRIPNSGNRPYYPSQPHSPLREGPPLRQPYPQPYAPPFGMGGNDLYPSGPGFGPQPFLPPGPGGGSFMGPTHPGFGPGVVDPYQNPQFARRPPPGRGPYPPSHPQGARFDPFGPPTGNHFGEPDPDEPPPNTYNNMFL